MSRTRTPNIARGIAGGCATAIISVAMLTGCAGPGEGTVETGAGDGTGTEQVAVDDRASTTGDGTTKAVVSDGGVTGTTGTGGMTESGSGSPSDEGVVSDATEVSAYAAKVGYLPEAGDGTVLIGDADAWRDYADSVSTVTYSDDGEARARPAGLRDYGDDFFAKGNRLLVRYQDLPTGTARPKVTDWSVDGDAVIISWDDGIAQDMVVTTDMSGFVTVVEAPAGASLTRIEFSERS